MKTNDNALLDKYFLKQLFHQTNQTIYVKIISLDFNENPREEIQGRVASAGSINIDGKSAVRRTCNLSLITDKINLTDYFWTLDSKFKLETGLKNDINKDYPEIIWFKQGVFIITSFNQQLTYNNCKISITGKDKMCLLNGEVGGSFTVGVDLAVYDDIDEKGNKITRDLLLREIILYTLTQFGGEKLENIIINDLEDYGIELMSYAGETAMYFFRNVSTGYVNNLALSGTEEVYFNEQWQPINSSNIEYYSLSPFYSNALTATQVRLSINDSNLYQIIKIEPGQAAGYRKTGLTYPGGELEAKAGETITSIFDKIVKEFSDFEYFYNIDGRFVFQKKKTYVNSAWSPIQQKAYVEVFSDGAEYKYSFSNSEIITNFTNTPNILNIKNDFSIWGTRKTETSDIDIHLRFAVDKKPIQYHTTGLGNTPSKLYSINDGYDWREIIYQMAVDHQENIVKGPKFFNAVYKLNPECINGVTGYEQYYIDILGFWRDIYDGKEWRNDVLQSPETIRFWFDFIEGSGSVRKQHSKNIGTRTKVVNDSSATAISFRDIVPVLFVSDISQENLSDDYTYIQIPESFESLFTISKAQKSLQAEMDKLLYNHLITIETISFSSIPVYTLEPNTKILIQDTENGIIGQYIINSISIPLEYNGKMTINAIKDIERIY